MAVAQALLRTYKWDTENLQLRSYNINEDEVSTYCAVPWRDTTGINAMERSFESIDKLEKAQFVLEM